MSDTKTTATAIVSVTLAVEVGSSWGGDCTMAQVKKQATEEAVRRLGHLRGQTSDRHVQDGVDGSHITEVRAIRIVLNEGKLV
jgi:hypothetical protein